jgi:hypothetical protein
MLKEYAIPSGGANGSKLHKEINDSSYVQGFSGVKIGGGKIEVYGQAILDENGLDSLVSAHEAVSLQDYKNDKNSEIDSKTRELINNGFTYDSTLFSLSTQAQTNWLTLKTLEAMFTWPVSISTMQNGEYQLAQENLIEFIGSGISAVASAYNSGRALKLEVNAASDKSGVDAVQDNR